MGTHILPYRPFIYTVSSHDKERAKDLSGVPFIRVLIPFTMVPPSWPNHLLKVNRLLISSPRGLGFQHRHFGGDTTIQSTARPEQTSKKIHTHTHSYACVGAGGIWKLLVFYNQLCFESLTSLKYKIYFKKFSTGESAGKMQGWRLRYNKERILLLKYLLCL